MNREQNLDRKNEAYELRLRGRSYQQIADEMGIGKGTAHRWVQETLEAVILPNVEAVRKQEVDRLMRYLERLDERIEDGDDRAISIALKISERLCKMLGADMPTQHIVEKHEVTQVDLAIRELIASQEKRNSARLEEAAHLREDQVPEEVWREVSPDKVSEGIEDIIADL